MGVRVGVDELEYLDNYLAEMLSRGGLVFKAHRLLSLNSRLESDK